MMKHFSVINTEWERLLQESDTSALWTFLDRYKTDIVESNKKRTPEKVRKYFSKIIADTLVSKEVKQTVLSHVEKYIRDYDLIQSALWDDDFWDDDSERPAVFDTLGVPYSSFEARREYPEIIMNLLCNNPGIMELFLARYPQEVRIRTIEAFLAKRLHPAGVNKYRDYSWESDRGRYSVSQNIHGDVHFGLYAKGARSYQGDLFSLASTNELEGEMTESLHVYQETVSLVGAICRYALHTGYVPEELENWQEILENTQSRIPDAAIGSSRDSLKYTASIHRWWCLPKATDDTGKYLYFWNTVSSGTNQESYTTALLHGDALVFAVRDENGPIVFSGLRGTPLRFRKTFELEQADIGPVLRALFHLPGRSSADNRIVLSAFDWVRKNGYKEEV